MKDYRKYGRIWKTGTGPKGDNQVHFITKKKLAEFFGAEEVSFGHFGIFITEHMRNGKVVRSHIRRRRR